MTIRVEHLQQSRDIEAAGNEVRTAPGCQFILQWESPEKPIMLKPVYLYGFIEEQVRVKLVTFTAARLMHAFKGNRDPLPLLRQSIKTASFGAAYSPQGLPKHESPEERLLCRLVGLATLEEMSRTEDGKLKAGRSLKDILDANNRVRIHGAETGRMSSSSPNIVQMDYAGLEARIAAGLSIPPELAKPANSNFQGRLS